jgi:hypothetical protein
MNEGLPRLRQAVYPAESLKADMGRKPPSIFAH